MTGIFFEIAVLLLSTCGSVHKAAGQEVIPKKLNETVAHLGRQMMLQQLFVEERIRSEGDSGIKIVRLNNIGPRPYYAESISSSRKVCAIHNHDNNIRTIGMGEFVAVLNGVEFRTRHNDYRLYMPSTTSSGYHEFEEIPFPKVPPAVLQFADVNDQVVEMREYFRAFTEQNTTHRDYRPYFKPVLCYLEGGWTTSKEFLDESFEIDQHFADADSWYDLQDKIQFTSYTGRKNVLENFSYLPTTIMEIINGTIPILAQWNYRIMCHPLANDLPTNRMRVVDDLAGRMRDNTDFIGYSLSRAARFQLNPVDSDEWTRASPRKQLLDKLMEEIPGKNNYGATILDDTVGGRAYPITGDTETPLNAAYYHRVYKVDMRDAMGLNVRRRGFHDQNIFMAATTQKEIATMTATFCERRNGTKKVCKRYMERWTYAIPLEIIYLTPLSSWNPYNLEYRGEQDSEAGKNVTANGRNGGSDLAKAYDGLNSKVYYMTPANFYHGGDSSDNDPADTSTGAKWVLDRGGVPRRVSTSGVRINTQTISGVGKVRQRYPIMPLHSDGNDVSKELEALKDIVLEPEKYAHMLRRDTITRLDKGMSLKMGSSKASYGAHVHYIDLTGQELKALYDGDTVNKTSTLENGHQHQVIIDQKKDGDGEFYYKTIQCDGEIKCSDGHPPKLIITE